MSITQLPAAPPRAPAAPLPGADPPLLELDWATREILVHGRPVALTRLEFELLGALAAHPAEVITKQRLLRDVWDHRHPVATRTVDTHAARLRAKLADPALLHTVRGVGYRLVGPRDVERVRVGRRAPGAAELVEPATAARRLSLVRGAPPALDYAQVLLAAGAGPLVVQGSRAAVSELIARAAAAEQLLVALRTLDGPLVSINPRHVVLVTGDEPPRPLRAA